ncbi:MAG TPA: tetratricopeptide repeat protein [Nostocaceae cyanobacterium]|nr:tetratricopeptide repeat protein [Nostocaceae cyanobacterium]
MQTLHLDLKIIVPDHVELRYFTDNPNDYKTRTLPTSQIADLLELSEEDYYVSFFPEDYAVTGKRLYKWLDGEERFLQRFLDQNRRLGVVLAFTTAGKLAHLPWEVLHDGSGFLVQKIPGVIPVRWCASESVNRLTLEENPENRALQMLFMATSPQDVEPVLDYEREEARILAVTARQQIALTVEESGCLTELGYLAESYGKGYFDVFHLTGHAGIVDGKPIFITETLTGERCDSSAEDIARELQFQLPKLIFLSGCKTGQGGNAGSVPSMAEELLKMGAKAVLGWGKSVLETDATEAAAALYQELAAGKAVTEAVACTYQALIKQQARDWHLLRLYVGDNLPGALVTPLRTRGRKPAPPLSVATEFLDAAGVVKVATRESFVGRRRQLQSCLRALTQLGDEVGVLIYGMGGLGKSSLAARLCDRLNHFQHLVWVGRIDESRLVSRLVGELDDDEKRKRLQNPDEELKFRLKRVFQQVGEEGKEPFLLVFDDFEINLDLPATPSGGLGRLQTPAVEVLSALVWAIRETYSQHRIILTCRYDFEFSQLRYFHKQPLEALRGADLRKKCDRLVAFGEKSEVDGGLKSQALRLADGNPRLLEWLNKILQNGTVDRAAILQRLEVDAVELREQVLAKALLQQMNHTMREMLTRGLVYELPVPRAALTAICEDIRNLPHYLDRAVALGLLEVSPDECLRVPRILPLRLDDDTALSQKAAEVLYRLWWEERKATTEEEWLEMHRLALLGKQEKIAAEIGSLVASKWKNKYLFREVVELCKSTLELVLDYRVLHELAMSEKEIGEIKSAQQHYQQALELCPETDNKEKASIIHNLGIIFAIRGEFEEAIKLYQQSLEIEENIGNWKGKASTLQNLAEIYAKREEFEEALALFYQSLEIAEHIRDVEGQAANFHGLGRIYLIQGKIEEAINFYRKSLNINEQVGNLQGIAATLQNLGYIYINKGEFDKAVSTLHQCLEINERIGDIETKAATLHELARIYDINGNFEEASRLFRQSLEINEHIEHVQGQAATLHELGRIYAKKNKFDQAISFYRRSLKIKEHIADMQGQGSTLHELGYIYTSRGEVDHAISLYQQSLEIQERIGNVQGQAATLAMLGQLLADEKGDFTTGLNYLQKSLEIFQRLQSPDAETVRGFINDVQKEMADNS